MLTLGSMLIAVLNVNHGVADRPCRAGGPRRGLAVGVVNGFVILYFRIHSLIVTLGMGTFIHGITLWFSNSQTISGMSIPAGDGRDRDARVRHSARVLLRTRRSRW